MSTPALTNLTLSLAQTRGSPPATSSNPNSSKLPSAVATPPPQPNGAGINEPQGQNGSGPVNIAGNGGHSRKGSIMVGGGVDIKPRGNLAFGTVDSPSTLLSSSPAAPSTTGAHLSDAVKTFGAIDAETSNPVASSMMRPPRRQSGIATVNPASPSQPPKKLDVHSLFAGKPQPSSNAADPSSSTMATTASNVHHDRRHSINQGPFPTNGMPNSAPHPYQQMQGIPGAAQPHLRPPQGMPNQPRSPVMNAGMPQPPYNQVPTQVQQGFRVPPMNGQNPVRPANGPQTMPQGMQRPVMMGQQGGPYGVHPQQGGYPIMGYGPQGGYYYNVPYEGQQYGMPPQWAHQQQQHMPSMPMSPRASQSQLAGAPAQQPSPAPHNATLPSSSGAASPMPTPPSRPVSVQQPSNSSIPSLPNTPSRPVSLQPAQSFTPQPNAAQSQLAALSPGAMAFTPRPKSTIKISRPDGTSLDLAQAAAAAKPPSSLPSSGGATPEIPSTEQAPSQPAQPEKKKVPSLPVVVRIETEEQKKNRLAEEEKLKKIKEEEAREEAERKERLARKAKEEEERKAKEEADKKEKADKEQAEKEEAERKKIEEALAAEQAAAKKAAEEQAAAAKVKEAADKEAAEAEAAAAHAAAQETRDKADEQRRALLTPSQSTTASPLSSPAMGAAGLPAKPVLPGVNGARRTTPSALEIRAATSSPDLPSALGSARPIEDISSIQYPSGVKPPSPTLNANAPSGKFRYDRDFLMQFMDVCKEKPETLPPLEEIGLEADPSSGFGQGRGARGGRSSVSGPARGGLAGLGISSMNRGAPFPTQGMGSFGMGNFGAGSSIRGTTSEDRIKASRMVSGQMNRTPSQGAGLPPMGLSTSRGGGSRSQRGVKRMPQDPRASLSLEPDVAPLVVSANAWVNGRSAGGLDEKSPAFIERKVKALLNKLTEEKFDSISQQILEWANKSRDEEDGMTLKLVIKQVFEKATDEAHWSAMYAKLCRLLLDRLDPAVTEILDGKPVSGGSLFRKYLLGRCQMDFESGWKAREDAAKAAAAKSEEDAAKLAKAAENKEKADEEGAASEAPMMSEEYYAAQKAKRRGLGLVQLIGELFKLDMLSKGVIRQCLIRLLGNVENPDEEDLESVVKLITTIGESYEKQAAEQMGVFFERLAQLSANENLASRIRFMIMDVIDLRKNKWASRKAAAPTTIAEVHQQAAREQAEKAQHAANAARESISRGGSRAGHSRRDGPQQVGDWQNVSTGARPTQRPSDFSNFGRGVSSAGLPSAPTFAPSGVFTMRGKKGGPQAQTPPLSRQASSTNMFGVLNEAGEGNSERRGSAEGAAPADAPQRKRLQLAPRTKPLPGSGDAEGGEQGEEGDDDEAGHDSEEDVEGVSTPAGGDEPADMTEEEAKTKIASDSKELWGEKDSGGSRNVEDIVEYYRSLPDQHKHLLSEKLGEDLFRICKLPDFDVVARGWKAVLEASAASVADLRKGIEINLPELEDTVMDFPNAYKGVAMLIRSLPISNDDMEALIAKITVYGTPRIGPKQKLERAITQIEEEEAAAKANA